MTTIKADKIESDVIKAESIETKALILKSANGKKKIAVTYELIDYINKQIKEDK